MVTRYVRDQDIIPNEIKKTRRSVANVQRPTGTEKSRTKEVASQALQVGSSAKSIADQAAEDVLQAYNLAAANATTIDGMRRVVPSISEPTAPAAGWMNGDQWWQYEVEPVTGRNRLSNIWVWNGTEFVEFQIVADSLLIPGSVGNILLADGAIDAMTITGALIRTAATGLRFEMDVLGLRAFNASNAVTASLKPESGGLLLSGSLTSYPGGNTPRAVLSNGGLIFDLPGSGGAGNLAVSPGNIRSSDSSTRLFIAKDSGSAGTGLTLQAGASPGNTAQIHVNGDTTGGLIELAAGTVRKSSDYTWAKAGTPGGPTLKTGWTNRTSLFDGLALQSKLDEVFLNGTFEKNSNYAALDVIATLPVGCRPTRLIAVNASYAGTLEYVLVYPNGNVAASRGGTSATWINIFGSFPTT